MAVRDIIYNGKKVASTWCEGCARRYVRMKLWKRGFRGAEVGIKLRKSRVVTATTFEYSYDENKTNSSVADS